MTAKRDENYITTMLGTLNTDGETPTNITVDPTTHIMDIVNSSSGSDAGNGKDDDNRVNILKAVSSSDGETPVALYVNSSGQLLVKS